MSLVDTARPSPQPARTHTRVKFRLSVSHTGELRLSHTLDTSPAPASTLSQPSGGLCLGSLRAPPRAPVARQEQQDPQPHIPASCGAVRAGGPAGRQPAGWRPAGRPAGQPAGWPARWPYWPVYSTKKKNSRVQHFYVILRQFASFYAILRRFTSNYFNLRHITST